MIDFIFATSYPSHFHAVNLQHNPSHYPAFARWLGSDYISKVQEWGAGIWYATMVDVDGQVRNWRNLQALAILILPFCQSLSNTESFPQTPSAKT